MQSDNKIPIKMIVSKDHRGTKQVEAMIPLDNLFGPSIDSTKEIQDFRARYLKVVSEAKEILEKARKKSEGSAVFYWKLGDLLNRFVNDKSSKFNVTNYRKAFEREINLSDTQIGELLEFVKIFRLDEISPKASATIYLEFAKKARKLEAKNLLVPMKNNLMRIVSSGSAPDSKKYRAYLSKVIQEGRIETLYLPVGKPVTRNKKKKERPVISETQSHLTIDSPKTAEEYEIAFKNVMKEIRDLSNRYPDRPAFSGSFKRTLNVLREILNKYGY